mgnify:CR=1 FL=1
MEKDTKKLQIQKNIQNLLWLVLIVGVGVMGYFAGQKNSEAQIANLHNSVLAEQRKSQIALEACELKVKSAEDAKASAENSTRLEIYTKLSNYLDKEINPVGKTAEVAPAPAVEESKK